jgi:BCD family chlorophyll transporter-like MFS transporter
MIQLWMGWVARFLPFADVASADLPLSRLLRLSLIQVSVGMCLVLLVGTLNRVMIVELGVPATLVGVMLALPLLAAPFRALIGHKTDTHKSALGWRRVPYIYLGTMVQFGGLRWFCADPPTEALWTDLSAFSAAVEAMALGLND